MSIATRNGSISLPYCTPEGQAVSHARQSRQSSRCRANAVVQLQPAVGDGPHQVDAAARAVVLVARLDVRRARGRAQAAVDAVEQQLVVERGAGIGGLVVTIVLSRSTVTVAQRRSVMQDWRLGMVR